MHLRTLQLGIPVAALVAASTPAAAAIEQQLTGPSTVALGLRVDGTKIAQRQSFALAVAGRLETVWLHLRNPALPWGTVPPGQASDVLVCDLRDDAENLLASASLNGFDAAAPTSRWVAIELAAAVTPGIYSVACSNTAPSWYVLHASDSSTAYAGGSRSSSVDGGAWLPGSGDLAFAAIVTAEGPCTSSPAVVCIHDLAGDRRFRAEVAFHTELGGGRAGAAEGRSLDAMDVDRGGMFWFFDRANPELLLKVLDGCGVNGRRWVFHSAGTNVGFTVVVTDTVSGAVWSSVNSDRTAAPPVQDTSALPCN